MFLTWLMLAVALCLSAIAAFYSIIGLTAIFAAAVVPVAVMGTILEIAKLTVTVWLHEYWHVCKRAMKVYLVPAVGILMLITSMGIFGFLSKAHLDQAVPAGDISAQVGIYDEKIKTQRDNIESARAALRQMDAAVDQQMARSTDEQGAQRAANLRRQQGVERNRLNQDISRAQAEIVKLQEQRAPIAAQARKVEAEVGPIKYIAALIYGDNPDQNLLEKAVRWVIIILVLVFDPLAIFMLLAATESYKWERRQRTAPPEEDDKKSDSEPAPALVSAMRSWQERIAQWRTKHANVVTDEHPTEGVDERSPGSVVDAESVAEVVGQPQTKIEYRVIGDADDEDPAEIDLDHPDDDEDHSEESAAVKRAKALWKERNPDSTLKEQRRLYKTGQIADLPWMDLVEEAEHPMATFGSRWPLAPIKGDQFIRTDRRPTELYKFNGDEWIQIDKQLTDGYAFNDTYIDFLISQISSGNYDPELLNDSEREQIQQRLIANLT